MIEIMLTMFGYWAVLGLIMAVIMILGLYFAHLCEFLVDFFFTK